VLFVLLVFSSVWVWVRVQMVPEGGCLRVEFHRGAAACLSECLGLPRHCGEGREACKSQQRSALAFCAGRRLDWDWALGRRRSAWYKGHK